MKSFLLMATAVMAFSAAPFTSQVAVASVEACCDCCSGGECGCAQCTCCDCATCPTCH